MFASFTCQAASLQSAFLAHRSLGHEVIKYFIDQACLGKIAGYWSNSFFEFLLTLFLMTSALSGSISTQRTTWLISTHPSRLVNNPNILI